MFTAQLTTHGELTSLQTTIHAEVVTLLTYNIQKCRMHLEKNLRIVNILENTPRIFLGLTLL